ncbi:shikimate dehydrogenase [Umezawaea endophytica]|uniref:Shikimate dehydrogenase n=1 Tax=Umezawaea endophytica TaxID=1654476 RepID=A0A9X3AFS0_9PSEU|nr:shikimate dehydrogenase [Umezawaea endophytica]MCS7478681.1 shikimate dehydrogenase [Umezawaea endophytica]
MSHTSFPDAVREHADLARGALLVGLVGAGIGPSLSPALHEGEARRLGLRYRYRRIDLADWALPPEAVGDVLAITREAGYRGLNITHPCKQAVLPHLDELSADAAALGAVNTVVFESGRAIGHNTDWYGFTRGLAVGLPGAGLDSVVQLGAGGAGAAVAHGLLTAGAGTVRIFDLDADRRDALVESLRSRFGAPRATAGHADGLAAAVGAADGLVHATPTGMAEHPGLPLPADLLRRDLWVAEVVYRPLDTALVTAARARGCRVLDGGRMFAYQAAAGFKLFTGEDPDVDRMLSHFDHLVRTSGERTTDAR